MRRQISGRLHRASNTVRIPVCECSIGAAASLFGPRCSDEYEHHALTWYRDPEVLRFSEGGSEPYEVEQIRAMFDALSRKGELYLIEHASQPIGDAALLPDDVPIVIGRPEDRSRGIGTEVPYIHPQNVRSQRLYARAGFARLADGTLRKALVGP